MLRRAIMSAISYKVRCGVGVGGRMASWLTEDVSQRVDGTDVPGVLFGEKGAQKFGLVVIQEVCAP
jgi:hypothetical protein